MSTMHSKYQTVIVSKEEAKKLIDASPSDKVFLTIVNTEAQESNGTELLKKFESYGLIDSAKRIGYEDHDMFGRMKLMDVLKEPQFLHYITFAQKIPNAE